MKKEIEQKFLDKLLYIGEEIPDGVSQDRRTKFVLLGTSQALIDEIDKLFSLQKQEIVEEIEKMKNTKMVSLCCKKTMTYGNSTQEYRCLACGKICEPYPSKDYNQALTESIEKIKRLE